MNRLVEEVAAACDFIWDPLIADDTIVSSVILGFHVLHKDNCASDACLKKRSTGLCSILDPGRPPKADKIAILNDVTHFLNQLHLEAQKLKESNEVPQEDTKNLMTQKSELKDDKVRLKAKKVRMEQMLKGISIAPPLIPHPAGTSASLFAACNKSIAHPNYTPTSMR